MHFEDPTVSYNMTYDTVTIQYMHNNEPVTCPLSSAVWEDLIYKSFPGSIDPWLVFAGDLTT